MNLWKDFDERDILPEMFTAVVEISKGSHCKYELDKRTGAIKLDRILSTSTQYPSNYGFIPLTYAQDNDPLDVLILCQEPLVPLSEVKCVPIGVINMLDQGEVDEKIIAIAIADPMWNTYNEVSQLPPHYVRETKHFFEIYKNLENKQTIVEGVNDKVSAIRIIRECLERYKKVILKE
ncbi:MAG: inorganic diphosphatase [Bacillales bacterium]|jgi:inorganic pyrophosphatase|nr:inorganic diphosphatase [Bacillales bacterium]